MRAESEKRFAGVPRRFGFQNFRRGALRLPTLDEMNLAFTAAVIGYAGLLGSVVSILVIGAILLAFLRLYQNKIALPTNWDVLAIAAAFAFYCLADAISGAGNFDGWNTLSEV